MIPTNPDDLADFLEEKVISGDDNEIEEIISLLLQYSTHYAIVVRESVLFGLSKYIGAPEVMDCVKQMTDDKIEKIARRAKEIYEQRV